MAQLNAESPPSYNSLYGQLKEAKSSSDGNVSFARKAFTIIFGSLACTLLLGFFLAIPVTCIVIGAIYVDDCPAERYIPIYLIVAGCFSIVKDLSSLIQKCLNRNEEEEQEVGSNPTNVFDGLIGCFLFAWFICGNVWIYKTYGHFSTDPTKGDYCHPTLYYFAFWLLNATYIIIGLSCLLCCCLGIVMAAYGDKE